MSSRTAPLTFGMLGAAFFAALLVLSLVYYRERSLTMDGAYYVYRLVQDDGCFYAHGRLGACLAQLLPWAVRTGGGSLRAILVTFSVSHLLVFGLAFAVVVLVLRQPARALAVPLLLAVGVRHVFYWPSELLQAVALLVVLLAWLHGRPSLSLATAALTLGVSCLLVAWFHLAVAAAALFALGFDILDRQRWTDWRAWLVVAGLVAFTAWTVRQVAPESYQGKAIFAARASLASVLTLTNLWRFFPRYLEVNALTALVAAAVLLFYLSRFVRRADRVALAKGIWVATCFLGYSLILFYQFQTPVWAHYFEHISTPLLLVAVVPLAWDVLPALGPVVATGGVALLLATGVVGIVRAHEIWGGILGYVERVVESVERFPERKFVTRVYLYSPWAFGVQTLILSSLTRPEAVTVLHAPDPGLRARLIATDALFHDTDLVPTSLPHEALDPGYFPLRKTRYRELSPEELLAAGPPPPRSPAR
jgi:hypothetical protein